MDVDCYNFQALLPSILAAISSSRFISLDLELSGIPRRTFTPRKGHNDTATGKQTLQQRYAETKAAAERFQILQLGLTCVEEHEEDGRYVFRPYNLHLSPLVDKRLKIERDITFQNSAVDFLLAHGFQIDAPFLRGISYLSREEEASARHIAAAEWDRDMVEDISIKPGDTENLRLMKRVREEIAQWQQQLPQEHEFLDISATESSQANARSKGLNRYQKRLIHQLVRAEYPDLVSISRTDFVQLLAYNKEREEAQVERKVANLERNLIEKAGVRWIIEAICSDIGAVIRKERVSPPSSAGAQPNPEEAILDRYGSQTEFLLKNKPILVGHNLFLDLIYLYACFFGPLPNQVEDFQATLANLFPSIIDTKYVADIVNHNSPHYNSSLEDIDQEFSDIPSPVIDIPPEFNRYAGNPRLHEAGYDSFLAARALTRLSTKLSGRKVAMTAPQSHVGATGQLSSIKKEDESVLTPLPHDTHSSSVLPPAPYESLDSDNMFQHPSLEEPEPSDSSSPVTQARFMMPPADDRFWSAYGRKLRVNGTVEGVCEV